MPIHKYATVISEELVADSGDPGVADVIAIDKGQDRTGSFVLSDPFPTQTIMQYFTGSGFDHFVCLLDFENWGTESCPRFAYYKLFRSDENSAIYVLCADVSSRFDWDLLKVDGSW